MVSEAEQHASDDKQKREQAEARNKLDNLIYSTEKMVKEHGAQLDDAARKTVEDALADARGKLESKDAAEMNRAAEALSTASHKLAEAMYSKTRQEGPGDGAGADGPSAGTSNGGPSEEKKEDVVDADFKEVK